MKRRILFVDDEPRILQGLRRMMRSMRHEWDMRFVESGAEALDFLAAEDFDVVVSDMRMPGMNGLELLELVQKRYPMMVRIILSGHSDPEMILKSVRSAHQYLSKPCASDMLISTVKRSCSLRDILEQDTLKQIVSKTDDLPGLPSLYTELTAELQSTEGSVQRVGQIIEQDVCMTAKILQLVNSSFFGLPHHVSKPSKAAVLLGMDTIRSLVLSIGVFSQIQPSDLSGAALEDLYDHSMRTGAIAYRIARNENMDEKMIDNAFMSGLLHDLGKLILAVNLPETYPKLFASFDPVELSLNELELDKLGATHAEVGAYLLGLWGLPDSVVEGVAFHHNPGACPTAELSPLTAVHAANILARHAHTEDGEGLKQKFDTVYMAPFDLEASLPEWLEIVSEIDQEAAE